MPQTFDHSGEAGLGYAYQGEFGAFGIGGKHFEMNYGHTRRATQSRFCQRPSDYFAHCATQKHAFRSALVDLAASHLSIAQQHNASYNDYIHFL